MITSTIAITTIITTEATALTAVLETATAVVATEAAALTTVGAFTVAVAPLGLALLVSTTAKFAASSSLFCHGVYPLFLRQRGALVHGAHRARSTTQ